MKYFQENINDLVIFTFKFNCFKSHNLATLNKSILQNIYLQAKYTIIAYNF